MTSSNGLYGDGGCTMKINSKYVCRCREAWWWGRRRRWWWWSWEWWWRGVGGGSAAGSVSRGRAGAAVGRRRGEGAASLGVWYTWVRPPPPPSSSSAASPSSAVARSLSRLLLLPVAASAMRFLAAATCSRSLACARVDVPAFVVSSRSLAHSLAGSWVEGESVVGIVSSARRVHRSGRWVGRSGRRNAVIRLLRLHHHRSHRDRRSPLAVETDSAQSLTRPCRWAAPRRRAATGARAPGARDLSGSTQT